VTTQIIFADRPPRMQTMAGLSSDQVERLVADVYAHGSLDPARRRAVGTYCAVLVVLIYLRHNFGVDVAGSGCSCGDHLNGM
jgi:hypothetical protein